VVRRSDHKGSIGSLASVREGRKLWALVSYRSLSIHIKILMTNTNVNLSMNLRLCIRSVHLTSVVVAVVQVCGHPGVPLLHGCERAGKRVQGTASGGPGSGCHTLVTTRAVVLGAWSSRQAVFGADFVF
jgi:hypothetical protein